MSEEIEKSGNKLSGLFTAIILLLIVAVGGVTFLWANTRSKLTEAQAVIDKQNKDMETMNAMMSKYLGSDSDDIRENFVKMLNDYDELIKNGTPEQIAEIEKQKEHIQSLMAELDDAKSNNRLNAGYISKLKKENDELRSIMRGYVYEIDSLNTLNLSLRNDLDKTTTVLTQTTTERDNLQLKTDALTEKVKEGQRLDVIKSSFQSAAMKQTLTNTMKETNRAKNVVQIQSAFTIGKNAITESGSKQVYMQVVGPDNKTLQNTMSGAVETESGNVPYSVKREIDYQNQSIDVVLYYGVREELSKGTYKVNIYCQGQLIGTDSFTLK